MRTSTTLAACAGALAFVAGLQLASHVEARGHDADREAVRRAVLDYVESAYEHKPENIERSVHPDLVKLGFVKRGEAAEYQQAPMSYEELHALVTRWKEQGYRFPSDAPKEVVVFDVLDQTAAAKLTADWGVDYFHLAKYDGKWKIIQVLWQTLPED